MTIEERLNRIEQYTLLTAKNALTMDDAAAFTGLSKAYIYKLVHLRKIPYYKGAGGKITYFSKPDLTQWLLRHRVASVEEAQEQAAAYVLNNPKGARGRRGTTAGEKGGAE